ALVALAAAPVPVPGRPVEHRFGGPADLLRPPAVPLLRGGAAPGGTLPPGGPVGSGRCHVGAGLRGVPPAAVWHRRPAPVRPGGERQESAYGGQRSKVRGRRSGRRPLPGRISLPVVSSSPTSDLRSATSGFDLMRLPLLGRFLRWRHARLSFQVPLLLL